jgi:hypothetical protein
MQNTEQKAQDDYDLRIAALRAWLGKDQFAFECAANDNLGDNALRKLSGEFGHFDSGWIDNIDFDQSLRDRLSAHTYQETIAGYAMARLAFRDAKSARAKLSVVLVALGVLIAMNAVLLVTLWTAS